MDVLFVNDVNFAFPTDSMYIGQNILLDILHDDYEVECINFNNLCRAGEIVFAQSLDENITLFCDYIVKKDPKVVGFYTIADTFITTVLLANEVKKMRPAIKILFGGPHASVLARECLEAFDFVDYISIGEGEHTIRTQIEAILYNKPMNGVLGLAYRDKHHTASINACPERISNAELTQHTVYKFNHIKIDQDTVIPIEGGRGCPYNCTFCSTSNFWGRQYRVKNPEDILQEMNKFHKLYGTYQFTIVHDAFTANKEYIKQFCTLLISNNTQYEWGCSSRIDNLDFDIIKLMTEANCKKIYLGIETGSASLQKRINKNLNLDEIIEKIVYAKERGMKITTSFIYGFPDEKIADLKDTLKLMERLYLLKVDIVQLHKLMLLPYTNELKKAKNIKFDKNKVIMEYQNLCTDTAIEFILRYPALFIQYYSFDSITTEEYLLLGLFIELTTEGFATYPFTLMQIVKRIGLYVFYSISLEVIRKIYQDYLNLSIPQRVDKKNSKKFMNNSIEKLVEIPLNNIRSEELKELFYYEKILFECYQDDSFESRVLELHINISKVLVHCKINN